MLRELLEGPIRSTPVIDDARRGFRFEGAITIGGMWEATAVSQVWRPRAESMQGTLWRLPFANKVIIAA